MTAIPNPFVAVTVAAANGQGITLSAAQCRLLAKNEAFFDEAIQRVTMEEFEKVSGRADARMLLSHFKTIDPQKIRRFTTSF